MYKNCQIWDVTSSCHQYKAFYLLQSTTDTHWRTICAANPPHQQHAGARWFQQADNNRHHTLCLHVPKSQSSGKTAECDTSSRGFLLSWSRAIQYGLHTHTHVHTQNNGSLGVQNQILPMKNLVLFIRHWRLMLGTQCLLTSETQHKLYLQI